MVTGPDRTHALRTGPREGVIPVFHNGGIIVTTGVWMMMVMMRMVRVGVGMMMMGVMRMMVGRGIMMS